MSIKGETQTIKTKQRGGKDPDITITRTRYVPTPKKGKVVITREQFHSILDKASQPISGREKGGTLESHPRDDCNETNTH